MFWWETIHATFNAVANIARQQRGQNWRLNTMHEDLKELAEQVRTRADMTDAKGDAILALIGDVKAQLAEALAKLEEVGTIEEAKAILRGSVEVLDSQLQQFDAALVADPPVDPA